MAATGVWVVFDPDGAVSSIPVISIETNELKASRTALALGKRVLFWPFGANFEDAAVSYEERRKK